MQCPVIGDITEDQLATLGNRGYRCRFRACGKEIYGFLVKRDGEPFVVDQNDEEQLRPFCDIPDDTVINIEGDREHFGRNFAKVYVTVFDSESSRTKVPKGCLTYLKDSLTPARPAPHTLP